MGSVTVDVSEMKEFFERVSRASAELKKEMADWLDAIGNEFLRIVEDEIVSRKVMDTRNLLASFSKGSGENIWKLNEGGLTLEVGSSTAYAGYVNDGHWTNPKGVAVRFVPGYWSGDRFIYDPSASGGMVLKQKWVEGAHYFDSALRILNTMFPKLIEAKMEEWLNKYFS